MSPQEQVAFDAACRTLHRLAKSTGCLEVSVFVKVDGRVSIYGAHEKYTKWWALADLNEGGAHPLPGAAIERETVPATSIAEKP